MGRAQGVEDNGPSETASSIWRELEQVFYCVEVKTKLFH